MIVYDNFWCWISLYNLWLWYRVGPWLRITGRVIIFSANRQITLHQGNFFLLGDFGDYWLMVDLNSGFLNFVILAEFTELIHQFGLVNNFLSEFVKGEPAVLEPVCVKIFHRQQKHLDLVVVLVLGQLWFCGLLLFKFVR